MNSSPGPWNDCFCLSLMRLYFVFAFPHIYSIPYPDSSGWYFGYLSKNDALIFMHTIWRRVYSFLILNMIIVITSSLSRVQLLHTHISVHSLWNISSSIFINIVIHIENPLWGYPLFLQPILYSHFVFKIWYAQSFQPLQALHTDSHFLP